VPRLALTRLFDKIHLKALASRAFRAPAVMNISLNPDIDPETATVLELEAGWQASDKTFITANVFDIVISDPISYTYDEVTETEQYTNFDRTARRGMELELRHVAAWGRLTARASSTRPYGDDVPFFQAGEDGWMLGLPRETASLQATLRLRDNLNLTPSLSWMGERKALTRLDNDGNAVVESLDAATLLALGVEWTEPLGVTGLELGLAVHDLLDTAPAFAQAYDSWHAPLPGPGREFALTLRYGGSWR
jgi:outer membrane receptor protein involved in Fe transport